MCSDGTDFYLTQMTGIFKVDRAGRLIRSVKAISHTGDVCWRVPAELKPSAVAN